MRSRLLRSALARWGRARRGMTLGVRVLALDEAGRVMLVRHGYAAGWHLPGGGVEPDETAAEAAIRELLEETGLVVTAAPRLIGLFFNPAFGGRDHVALFRADAFTSGPEPAPNYEIAERGWFTPDAPPEATTPATRRRLAALRAGEEATGRW